MNPDFTAAHNAWLAEPKPEETDKQRDEREAAQEDKRDLERCDE